METMTMRWLAALVFVVGFMPIASAQDADSVLPYAAPPRPAPQAAPAPQYAPCDMPACQLRPARRIELYQFGSQAAPGTVDHLRAAAEHLEAAGLKEEASRIRHEARRRRDQEQARALLQTKLRELEDLESEIEQLRQAVEGRGLRQPDVGSGPYGRAHDRPYAVVAPRQVMIAVKVFSVSADALATPGDREAFEQFQKLAGEFAVPSGDVLAAVENLQKRKLIKKVLAEPTLVTVSGRQTFFRTGAEVPVPVIRPNGTVGLDPRQIGTQVEMLPTIESDEAISLELKVRVANMADDEPPAGEEQSGQRLRVREVDTGARLEKGQSLLIGWPSDRAAANDEAKAGRTEPRPSQSRMFVLVTPELVDCQMPGDRSARVGRYIVPRDLPARPGYYAPPPPTPGAAEYHR